jgi:hypothetical protein
MHAVSGTKPNLLNPGSKTSMLDQVQKHPKAFIKLTAPSLFLPDAVSAMDW